MFNHPIASKHLFDLILICIQQQGLTQFNVEKHMGHLSTWVSKHRWQRTSGSHQGTSSDSRTSKPSVRRRFNRRMEQMQHALEPLDLFQANLYNSRCLRPKMHQDRARWWEKKPREWGALGNLSAKGEVVAVCWYPNANSSCLAAVKRYETHCTHSTTVLVDSLA